MDKDLKAQIEYLLCIRITRVEPLSGGDISKAFLLDSDSERFFCKYNSDSSAFQMFQAEKAGLEAIAETKTIATPKVLLCEQLNVGAFLLLEYIEPKQASAKDMQLLGQQLAAMHQWSSSNAFGWKTNNYIGSLPQANEKHADWSAFYGQERLLPQLQMAKNKGGLSRDEIPSELQLIKTCENILPKVTPSLLHGDLWSGNYLIAKDGTPYLIDPAAYFGHHEVDVAMTKLFGGFDHSFYSAYEEQFPKTAGVHERNDLYQLYYLLVHLNLFGASYKTSVTRILKRYFF